MKTNSVLKEILSTSIYILTVVIVAFLIVRFVAQRTEVIGNSMQSTLNDGDNLILNKISYKFNDPARFDIVVFPFRDNSGKNYIKRIIALPGESIRIDNMGVIYVNGEVLEEDYGIATINNPGRAIEEITLSSDEYFVLGDNRNASEDSRFGVGTVKRDEIIGKVNVRIWPLKTLGRIEK